jgi:predicted lipoprotein
MMTRIALMALCALIPFGLAGCKIVKDTPADQAAVAADASGDTTRIANLLEETFTPKLLPHLASAAVDVPVLRSAVAAGLDAAGAQYGNRGAGAGSAWAFPLRGTGKIVAAKLDSRARTLDLDTTGDGAADLTVQLGPVFKGTSLRDVAPFFVFTDFRDQIEYAKLARELNDKVGSLLVLPEGDPTGKTLRFLGALSLKTANDPWLVTPVEIEVLP